MRQYGRRFTECMHRVLRVLMIVIFCALQGGCVIASVVNVVSGARLFITQPVCGWIRRATEYGVENIQFYAPVDAGTGNGDYTWKPDETINQGGAHIDVRYAPYATKSTLALARRWPCYD